MAMTRCLKNWTLPLLIAATVVSCAPNPVVFRTPEGKRIVCDGNGRIGGWGKDDQDRCIAAAIASGYKLEQE
jgi:hypothetical protein